jgi:hypothetical protein
MRGSILRLTTSLLILNLALFPPILNAQARSPPRDVRPDSAVPPGDGHSSIGAPSENGTLPVESDRTYLRVDVYRNGTASWRIEYWIRLENRSTRARFERFNQSVDQGSTATSDRMNDRVGRSVEAAEAATDRQMAVEDLETNTTVQQIPKKYGVVVYSFRWHGFANSSADRLRIGDALRGLYLGSGDHLVVSWPNEYVLAEVEPAPDATEDKTAVWHGPSAFGLDGPRLLLVERSRSSFPFLPVALAVAVALVTALWLVRRTDDATLKPSKIRAVADDGDRSELLSNEEQVIRCLENHGGRVRQQTVAEELGWTTSKTSYVVSNLREEGEIHTFRLGHENVLSLSDSQTTRQPENTVSS